LLDISGQVIGVNTAMAEGAENIGFAIPVNDIKDTLNDVREHGRIIQAWLGVRYITITPEIAQANNLGVDHGALIVRGRQPAELAVIPGSPADKAGLEANDIILEVDGEEINQNNSLADVINKSNPGDVVTMLVLRAGEESEIEVELEERN
jgi:serine protease Do